MHGYKKLIKVIASLPQKYLDECVVGTKREERLRRKEEDGLVLSDEGSYRMKEVPVGQECCHQ